ncbi:hypothetical protein DTO271D3_392 [Paecilomyces variotii]|nr:hypothetical protein DTO271D3_392 [Paecilomyces variotii]
MSESTSTRYKRSAPDSSPATRVKGSLVQILLDLITAIEDGEPVEHVKEALETIKTAIVEPEQLSPFKKAKSGLKVTQASRLGDNLDATAKLSLDYWIGEAHLWQQPEGPEVHLSPGTADVRKRIQNAKFWRRDSSGTLSRTLIDLVLFDRLEAQQQELGARKISLRGEYPVETRVPGEREIITGNAHYALGYDTLGGSEFEPICVIMEGKNNFASSGGSDGISQAVAYMVGFQQKRMSLKGPKRIVDTTYGVVSDGILWWFLRLSGNFLQISEPFTTFTTTGCVNINRFLDCIIKSSISLSPHTTPQRRLPETGQRWEQNIKSPIFDRAQGLSSDSSENPVGDIPAKIEDSLQCFDGFEILRPGPGEVVSAQSERQVICQSSV